MWRTGVCGGVGLGILLMAVSGVVPFALAEDQPVSTPSPTEQTIQGEVVDPAAYLKDGTRGPETAHQTYDAVDGGQSLALLENGTGALYLLLAEQPGEDPNELVYGYVNQIVKVKGRVFERGRLKGLVVSSVEPVEPAAPQKSSGSEDDT